MKIKSLIKRGINYIFQNEFSEKKQITSESTKKVIPKLAFLLQHHSQTSHFKPVWNQLARDSFDIILHKKNDFTHNEDYSQWSSTVTTTDQLESNALQYQYLVSTHPICTYQTPLIKRIGKLNIRYMYAAGKSGWNLSDWNRLYDMILCFGPHHANAFKQLTDAIVLEMGFPRLDRFFTDTIDKNALLKKHHCDLDKKTVVWLPTWKQLSSVGLFDEEISELTKDYNVITKLHPLMKESEPGRVEALLKHHFTTVITDHSDNLELYQLADYMLFDYGGPPLTAIYTDKNMILLNVPHANEDQILGADSPDLTIRNTITSIHSEQRAIKSLLEDESVWLQQKDCRKIYREIYFAPYYGYSATVAANILKNLDTIFNTTQHNITELTAQEA